MSRVRSKSSSGSSVASTIVDAAGDLIVGTANDTVGRLPKGSALQVLRVKGDGSTLEYADPAAGGGGAIAGVFNVRDYGALGDGTTNDNTAIQAAFTAAKATGAGGVVLFPPGVYLCSGTINLDAKTNISIKGYGARTPLFANSQFGGPRSELRYTGTGSASFISNTNGNSLLIDGVAIRYSSATYTGRLIDVRGLTSNINYGAAFRNCLIGGSGTTAVNAVLVDCDQAVEHDFSNVMFERGLVGVSGRTSGSFSNAVMFNDCHFAGLTTAVLDPFAQWSFTNCVFEPAVMTQTGATSPIRTSFTAIHGLSLSGCGFWDGTSGYWIDVSGDGLNISGGYWEPQGGASEGLVRVRTTAANPNFTGLAISGLRAEGVNGSNGSKLITWSANNSTTDTLTGVQVAGNSLASSVTAGLDTLTGPFAFAGAGSAARFTDYGTPGTSSFTLGIAPVQRYSLSVAGTRISMPKVAAGVRTAIEVELVQDSVGGRLASFDPNVFWHGGQAPTLSTAPRKVDILRFATTDGLTWAGSVIAQNAASSLTVTAFNPLTAITWDAAYWASDPSWTPPADGGSVASWRDGSGNSRTLTASGTAQPTYRAAVTNLNGKPGVEFDGTSDVLLSPSFTRAQTFSLVMFMADVTGNAGGARVFSSINQPGVQVWADATPAFNGFAGSAFTFGSAGSGGQYVFLVFNGSSSVAADGAAVSTGLTLGSTGITTGIALGARGDSTLFGAMKAGFVGVYAGDIRADANFQALRYWAQQFYGLSS